MEKDMTITYTANIDRKLLRKQRSVLARLLYDEKVDKKELKETLEGVCNLLDDIQDELDNAAKNE
jgi:hypothetical protein